MALLLSPKRRKRSQRKPRLRQRQPPRLKLEPPMPTYGRPLEPGEVLVRVQLEEHQRVGERQPAELTSGRLRRDQVAPFDRALEEGAWMTGRRHEHTFPRHAPL